MSTLLEEIEELASDCADIELALDEFAQHHAGHEDPARAQAIVLGDRFCRRSVALVARLLHAVQEAQRIRTNSRRENYLREDSIQRGMRNAQ